MSLVPRFFGRRSSVFDPFSLDLWDTSGWVYGIHPGNLKVTYNAHFNAESPGWKKDGVDNEVEDGQDLQISGERERKISTVFPSAGKGQGGGGEGDDKKWSAPVTVPKQTQTEPETAVGPPPPNADMEPSDRCQEAGGGVQMNTNNDQVRGNAGDQDTELMWKILTIMITLTALSGGVLALLTKIPELKLLVAVYLTCEVMGQLVLLIVSSCKLWKVLSLTNVCAVLVCLLVTTLANIVFFLVVLRGKESI